MKHTRVLLVLLLLLLAAVTLCACAGDEPEDTTAPATTTPTSTTPQTSGAAATTPQTSAPATSAPATSAPASSAPITTTTPNPIKRVKVMDADHLKHPYELRLTYADNTLQFIERELSVGEGFNSLTYTHSFDEESGILTLTLTEASVFNIANRHLGKAVPTVLCLRENAGRLEWTRKGEDAWEALCRTDDGDISILSALRAAVKLGEHPDAVVGDGVTLVISGNNLRFRAHDWQREGYDIVTDCERFSDRTNGNFMQSALREIPSTLPKSSMDKGTFFKSTGDEIPAFNMNGTYIAAAHGTYCISAVPNAVVGALSEEDIGKVFTRESDGQRYVLVKVPSGDGVWFCPFDDAAMESGNFGGFCFAQKGFLNEGDVLTYDSTKTFTVSATATQKQFYVATNGRTQHALLNGTVEVDLAVDGVYTAEFVDLHETYNVLYLPAVLRYLMDNVGELDLDGNPISTNDAHHDESINEYYLTYDLTHRFHRNGSYTVYQTVTVKHDIEKVHYFGVMSGPFSDDHHYIYAPGSDNLSLPTLQTNVTTEARGDATLRSFYQLTTTDGQKGINVGYYPYFGVATDENRPDALALFKGAVGQWYSSRKMYPYLYKADSMKAGETISFIGYHVPTVKFDDDFFAINWYFVDDEIYLSFHTDKAVSERTVFLPSAEYLTGLSITVEEASDSFTVHSDTVGADGIRVSTTGAGYCTVKLTKAN